MNWSVKSLVTALAVVSLLVWSGCDGGARHEQLSVLRARHLGKVNAERDEQPAFALAATYFQAALKKEPTSALDQLNLAKCLVFSGENFDVALTAALEADRLYGADAPTSLHYVTGICLVRVERYAEAAERFALVTDKLPWHKRSWFHRGKAEEMSQQLEAAAASFAELLKLDPDNRRATYRAAKVAQARGLREESIRLHKAFAAMPEDPIEKGPYEKCELTRVTLRPYDRSANEPARVKLAWTDVTAKTLGSVGDQKSSFRVLGAVTRPPIVLVAESGGEVTIATSSGSGYQASETHAWGRAGRVVAGDFDNDKFVDVFLAPGTLLRGTASGKFQRTEVPSLVSLDSNGALHPQFAIDIDHDSDLDIICSRADQAESGPIAFLRNDGDLTFSSMPAPGADSGVTVTKPFGALAPNDFDQANDADLVAVTPDGLTAHLNLRDGTFTPVKLPFAAAEWTRVVAGDFTSDGSPDAVAVTDAGRWQLLANADHLGLPYQLRMKEWAAGDAVACAPVMDACHADVDNDGDLDVVFVGAKGISVLRNEKGGKLTEEALIALDGARQVGTADLTGDGMLELIVAAKGGVRVFAGGASPQYASIVLIPDGSKDNEYGVGIVAEIYIGNHFQSHYMDGSKGLHIGVGDPDRSVVDGFLLRWPNGVRQAVIGNDLVIEDDGIAAVPQKEAPGPSCPYLYCYGENGWEYVTDILGIAPLGEWLPPGGKPHRDPEEFVRIAGSQLVPKDGKLHLTITEELPETSYLDRLDLHVVDHPVGTSVYINESTGQGAYDPLAITLVRDSDLSKPTAVQFRDGDGTALLAERDRKYLHGYKAPATQLRGWVEPFTIEMTASDPVQTVLLEGRVLWYDSAVSYSAYQSGRKWGPHQLRRHTESGVEVVVEDLGLPAGMDRTMVARLGDVIPAGTRLSLKAHHRLLWDRIRFASQTQHGTFVEGEALLELDDGTKLQRQLLQPQSGELFDYGYARIVGDPALHEHTLMYEENEARDKFARATGTTTRYGDVKPLIGAHDDQVVVIVPGDGVRVTFDAPAEPAKGLTRTYFLRVSGWAKENGYHNPGGTDIGPLPFRGMESYPPDPSQVPTSAEYREYLNEYHTRRIGH